MTPLTCDEWTELVEAFLAGELAVEVHARFEQHRCGCGACHGYFETVELTIRITRCLPKTDPLPDGMEERFKARLAALNAGAGE